MIHEIAIQTVDPSRREEYIEALGQALREAGFPGSHAIKLFASIEDPSRVILMIQWDSLDAHAKVRGSPAHNHMREVAARYQTAKSDLAHFVMHDVKS